MSINGEILLWKKKYDTLKAFDIKKSLRNIFCFFTIIKFESNYLNYLVLCQSLAKM